MPSEPEHYGTLFDFGFLPQGLALHASLLRHGGNFVLWVLCMDERVQETLRRLDLPGVRLIALRELEAENPRLLDVKAGRSRGEYCWTLTAFLPPAIFARAPQATRATYLDADLFILADPRPIFAELERSGKDALITEHDYEPCYDLSALSGRFCVQFMPFRRTEGAARVLGWWQERVLEWCYARAEDGKFGDQKYLDAWPELFPGEVHILEDRRLALAPWNLAKHGTWRHSIFYHMHSLRIHPGGRVRLQSGYRLPKHAIDGLYADYLRLLAPAAELFENAGGSFPAVDRNWKTTLRRWREMLHGRERFISLARFQSR